MIEYIVNGIQLVGKYDDKNTWYLEDPEWKWVDGKRPPGSLYVSISILDNIYVHTKEVLKTDEVLWNLIFQDIATNTKLDMKVSDKYTCYDGTPNDIALGVSCRSDNISIEMQNAFYNIFK